jgi:hypothetical protein
MKAHHNVELKQERNPCSIGLGSQPSAMIKFDFEQRTPNIVLIHQRTDGKERTVCHFAWDEWYIVQEVRECPKGEMAIPAFR